MDITTSTVQIDTEDRKMEAHEARPKDGGKDPIIPQEHVEQVNKALTDQNKSFGIKVYAEAGHGFFCNERPSYHVDSAKDAWEKFKSFCAQHLK